MRAGSRAGWLNGGPPEPEPPRGASRVELRLVIGMGLFFLLLGLFGAIASWGSHRLDVRLHQQGLRAEARIIDKHTTFVADEGSEYFIRYAFTVQDGRQIESQHAVSKREWQALRVGETLQVLYLAERPGRNVPTAHPPPSLGLTVFISAFMSIFALLGAALVIAGWRGLRDNG